MGKRRSKEGGMTIGPSGLHWDAGRFGTLVYFIGTSAAIALFIYLVNSFIQLAQYLPDEKIRGAVVFILIIIGIFVFFKE